MHLKSISLKGFKSFPERTRLQFSPGVSVVVGPNGSGKSNITDAVLWALGEQSPGAVRGASEFSEVFGQRSLDRNGEGTYRLNGARCRLVDIVEVLSDTNLGREMH